MSTTSAILLIVFNRPAQTRRVMEAIRQARPPALYVAADGPRPSRAGEAALCEEVRRIASDVDWPCKVQTLFHEKNQGCKVAESSAMSWFFANEPEGIVLEDDCVPHPSFFSYCDELLARYRDDERIMCISGDNFVSAIWLPPDSYYFSRFPHGWGWASWRRAWVQYDVDLNGWRERAPGLLNKVFPDDAVARRFWADCFDGIASGRIDTWDYQWTYACWRHGGLTCLPRSNLISNVGFGEDATHTFDVDNPLANLEAHALPVPLQHPQRVERAAWPDDWSTHHLYNTRRFTFWRSLFRSWKSAIARQQPAQKGGAT